MASPARHPGRRSTCLRGGLGWSLVLLPLVLAASRRASGEPLVLYDGGVVEGTATSTDGSPLAGVARLVVLPGRETPTEVRIAPSGTFRFEQLGRGTARVEVAGDDGVVHRVTGVGLPHRALLPLRRPVGLREFAGTVTNVAGEPIPGAPVRATFQPGANEDVEAQTTTRPDGTFRLVAHPQGWLRIEAAGYGAVTTAISTAKAAGVVRLPRAATVAGRVRHHGGRPAVGTTIWARPRRAADDVMSRPSVASEIAVTDADGRFGPVPLDPGAYTVFALGAGVVSREVASAPTTDAGVEVIVRRGIPADVSLVVQPAATVEGVVVDAHGRRAPEADIVTVAVLDPLEPPLVASPWGAVPESGPVVRSDAMGRFRLDGLVPGRRISLVARRRGAYGTPLSCRASRAETIAPVTLTVTARATRAVRLVGEDGRPYPQVRVESVPVAGVPSASAVGVTGDDGIALLDGVPDGDVRFAAMPPGSESLVEATPIPAAGSDAEPLTLRVRLGTPIRGRVRCADGPHPANIRLTATAVRPTGPATARRRGAVGADGTFEVWCDGPGRWVLAAEGGDSDHGFGGDAVVDAGADGVELLLRRQPRASAPRWSSVIRVVGPDGTPVFGARLEAAGGFASGIDVEGGIAHLSSETPTLLVRVRDAHAVDGAPLPVGPLEQEITLDASHGVLLVLPPERRISGRLLEPDGRPAVGVRMLAMADVEDALGWYPPGERVFGVARTDAAGRFAFGQLVDRNYDVLVPARPSRLALAARGIAAGTDGVVLRSRRAAEVVVTVTDTLGRPVSAATVGLAASRADGGVAPTSGAAPTWGETPPVAETDALGRARLGPLDPDGVYRLVAQPPSRRVDVLPVSVDPWRADALEVVLPAGLSVRGITVDATGRPQPWVHVGGSQGGRDAGSTMSDANGRFALERLAAGSTRLIARVPGPTESDRGGAGVTVEAGSDRAVLVVDPGPLLVLRRAGAAFPGSDAPGRLGGGWTGAQLFDRGPNGGHVSGFVEDGRLVFRRVRPGMPYTIWIPSSEQTGGTWFESGTSLVAGERTIELHVGAPIRGRVDARPTTRLGFRNGVWLPDVVATRGPVTVAGGIAADGTFEFPPLAPGIWSVRVRVRTDDGAVIATAEAEAGAVLDLHAEPE